MAFISGLNLVYEIEWEQLPLEQMSYFAQKRKYHTKPYHLHINFVLFHSHTLFFLHVTLFLASSLITRLIARSFSFDHFLLSYCDIFPPLSATIPRNHTLLTPPKVSEHGTPSKPVLTILQIKEFIKIQD